MGGGGVPDAVERWATSVAVAAIGNPVIVTDLDGVIRGWNSAAEQMYGWTAEEVVGRDILEVVASEASTGFGEEVLTALSAGVSWTGEFEVRHRDGSTFPVLVTDTPLFDEDGDLIGIVGTSVDISDVRQAREQAQTRAAQQAAVAQLAHDALADLPIDDLAERAVRLVADRLDVPLCGLVELMPGNETFRFRAGVGWQPGTVGLIGIRSDTASQAGYTLAQDQAVVVPDLALEDRFEVTELVKRHGAVSTMSTVIRGRGSAYGTLNVFSTQLRTFTDDDIAFLDAVAGVLGGAIARDAAERELVATVGELARSEEIRIAFLRATSHELRTPLSGLVGFAETLQQRDGELDPSERAMYLERLVANADRLARLIEDLLDVDRLASGLVTAVRNPHDVRDLVTRVLDEVDLADTRLVTDLEDVTAHIDAPKIERVVANLVANAVRHTPARATIHVTLQHVGDATVVRVEDDGPGLDEDYLGSIFEPFVQGPERHGDAKPGTGLGLTLARELVALHDGQLTASNREEGGARFEVRLPDVAPG